MEDLDLPRHYGPGLPSQQPLAWTWIRHDRQVGMMKAVTDQHKDAPGVDLTLGTAWDAWQKTWACAEGTAATRNYRWRMLGTMLSPETSLAELTLPRLRELQGELLRAGKAPATTNDLIGKLIRPIMRHAVELGREPSTPWLR